MWGWKRGVRKDAMDDYRFDLVMPLLPHGSSVYPNPLTQIIRSFMIWTLTLTTHLPMLSFYVVVVQWLSDVWLSDPMNCSTPSFPVLHYLPEFTKTCIHWVIDAIKPSQPLLPLLPSPLAFNLSQNQYFFQRASSSHQVAKGLELQDQFFQWILRVDFH